MNVTELARQLRINTKNMLEILPQYGFSIGARAIKVDNKVADQIIRRWKFVKRDIEEKKRKNLEEQKIKEKELRKLSGHRVALPEIITVRTFAEKLNMSITQVIMELMKNGILANQNQNIDYDTATIIAEELGFTVEKEGGDVHEEKHEEEKTKALENALAQSSNKKPRSPVIVVMGHVDHGKTKLLDAIRHTNVIDTESGGITQHIGAYQTVWKDPKTDEERAISFIDTPGHEAFTVMRSRGAKVADIAIMLVAADDGVKPQTEEVIKIIKAAKLPFIVAINKIDKDGADPQRVRADLSQCGIQCEEWGGDVPMVEISAKQKINIDKLLDVVLLVADMNAEKIQADPEVKAVGTIIESHVDKGMGPVATILIQSGTLKRDDPLVVNGEIYGKVRAMKDYAGRNLESAGPSVPVQIIGFKVAPEVGDILDVARVENAEKIDVKEKKLRQTGAERQSVVSSKEETEAGGAKKVVNLLIKADVLGSWEAILGTLEKFHHDEVGVVVVGKGLGFITEDDVNKAEAAGAHIIGFKVNPTPSADILIREKNLPFTRYDVIYDLFNWVKAELSQMLSQEKIINDIGKLKVLAIFRTDKNAMTVGGRVMEGKVKVGANARVIRSGLNMGNGKVVQCKIGPQDVKDAIEGTECGIRFEGKAKIEVGDIVEVYTEETKEKKIGF